MPPSDEEIVRRIRGGDLQAFENLYNHFRKPIANYLYRLCLNRSLVDDLLQEVFVRVWRGCRTFRGEAKLSTYIFRIATNVWFQEARRRSRDAHPEEPDPVETPSESAEKRELEAQLRAALGDLPETERAILILAHYNRLPYEEIARIQEIPVGTVKSRVFRAIQMLRDRLKGRV